MLNTVKDDDEDDIFVEVKAVKPFVRPDGRTARRKKIFSLIRTVAILVLPSLLGGIYLFGISSNMYAVNAIVMVRIPVLGAPSSGSSGGSSGGALASLLGGGGSGGASGGSTTTRAIDESYAVVQYIQSQAAFRDIDQEINFRQRFSSSNIDWWHRLPKNATFLQEYNYYLNHISVNYDDVEGQILLSTYGFTPDLTLAIAKAITHASERLVNKFNDRATRDYIALAERQLAEKKQAWIDASNAVTQFQLHNSIIDPSLVSTSYNGVITTLISQAAALRAQIASIPKLGGGESPQAAPLRNQLKALEDEIQHQQSILTGSSNTIALKMARFTNLTTEQQIAQQEYVSAVSMVDGELFQAKRQMLYIVSVVPPELPVLPEYPERWKDLAIIFSCSVAAWMLIRICVAALKDHLA